MTDKGPQSRVARNRARRLRTRGLVRLGALVAVVIAVIVTIVVLTAGGPEGTGLLGIGPIEYPDEIARVAHDYGLDPYLIASVAKAESGYNPRAVSPDGATGVMQLMPATARWITSLDTWRGSSKPVLTDAGDSLELGACYLQYLKRQYGGVTRLALAAYNAGPGKVDEWLQAAGGGDEFQLSDIKFPETQEFVRRVEQYWQQYPELYPKAFQDTESSVTTAGSAGTTTTSKRAAK